MAARRPEARASCVELAFPGIARKL
jgi:hypothetical protein